MWYGESSIGRLFEHVTHEMYDPGSGSSLDKATTLGFMLSLMPAGSRPTDIFASIDAMLGGNSASGAKYANYTPSAGAKNTAVANVNAVLDAAPGVAAKLKSDFTSGETARAAGFQATLNVGDAYIGSDEWVDAHVRPSHFFQSAFLQNAMYESGLIGTSAVKKGDPDPHQTMADNWMTMYSVRQEQQSAIDKNKELQGGKSQ